jgi:hypothetical protein
MSRRVKQLYTRLKPLMAAENLGDQAGNKISAGKNKKINIKAVDSGRK